MSYMLIMCFKFLILNLNLKYNFNNEQDQDAQSFVVSNKPTMKKLSYA